MTYRLERFDDFHLHGASAPEWKQRYMQMTRGEMRSSLAEATTDRLHVFRKWMSERVVQQGCLPEGKTCFGVLGAQGAGVPRIQGKEVGPDSLFVIRGGEEFMLQRPKGMELLAVTFDAEEFMRVMEERSLAGGARGLLARSLMQAPLRAMQQLRGDLSGSFSLRQRGIDTVDVELHGDSFASQRLLHSVLDVIEGASGSRQTVGSASASSIVARCHDIVAASGDEPPSIEALCVRLRASRRTLQNSFRQVAEMTPAHYLRCVRLDAVRRQLLSTRSGEVSIAEAAMNRGFTHLSHFTGHYRELFGELPSQTLRQRDSLPNHTTRRFATLLT